MLFICKYIIVYAWSVYQCDNTYNTLTRTMLDFIISYSTSDDPTQFAFPL